MRDDSVIAETSDLVFTVVRSRDLPHLRRAGLRPGHLPRFDHLDEARRAAGPGGCILVIRDGGDPSIAVPPEHIANLAPYRRPRAIQAGGGIVVREGGREPDVLLIFRRGKWDLPKGKPEPGETIEECAVREVREEIGVASLDVLAPAGTTLHGYAENDRYLVKTTTWLFMSTPERTFAPQAEEDIESVEWAPWSEARERLGYETLRRHLDRLGAERARAALAS